MIVGYALRFIVVGSMLAGCSQGGQSVPPGPPPASTPPTANAAAEPSGPLVVFLGTSLTAGYGLSDPNLAYPALIQRKIDSAGLEFRAVNRGISGETSAGALARIDWVLKQGQIAVLVVETGANDGLRGHPPDSTRANIQSILDRAKALDPAPRLVVVGMEAMPNLGADYTRRFRAIYPELARANGAALVPFLLDRVAGVDSLNQEDGIHPTPRGQQIVAETVWKVLEGVLGAAAGTPAAKGG